MRLMDRSLFLFLILCVFTSGCNNAVRELNKPRPPKIDIEGPKVVARSPEIDASNINLFEIIRITVNEALDTSTIDDNNIQVFRIPTIGEIIPVSPEKDMTGKVIGITYNASDHTLRFKPAAKFDKGSRYQVKIMADSGPAKIGLKDLVGNVLQANEGKYYSWFFTTTNADLPPAIASFSPLPNELLKNTRQPIEVHLNTEFISTINETEGAISVALNGKPWGGKISYHKDPANYIIRFIPDGVGWPLDSTLEVSLNVSDASVVPVIDNFKWKFDVRNGVFDGSKAMALSVDGEPVMVSRIITDKLGNVVILWIKKTFTDLFKTVFIMDLYASRYQADENKWYTEAIENLDPVLNKYFSVFHAYDVNGNIAVAYGYDNVYRVVRYDHQNRWDVKNTKILFTSSDYNVGDLKMFFQPNGNLVIIWGSMKNLETVDILALQYLSSANTWETTPSSIKKEFAALNLSPFFDAVQDAKGNIFVFWQQGNELLANRLDALTGQWRNGTNLYVISVGYGGITLPKILVNPEGDITLLWTEIKRQTNLTIYNESIYANHFINGSWYRNPIKIDTRPDNIGLSDLYPVIDHLGNINLTWMEFDELYATHFEKITQQWRYDANNISILLTSPKNTLSVDGPPIMLNDQKGNTTVMFKEAKTFNNLYASRFNADIKAWQPQLSLLENINVANEDFYTLQKYAVMDLNGNITLVWLQGTQLLTTRYEINNGGWQSDGVSRAPISLGGLSSSMALTDDLGRLRVDGLGNVTFVWTELKSGEPFSASGMLAKRYNSKSGWDAKTYSLVFDEQTSNIIDNAPFFEVDHAGHGTVAWFQDSKLWVNRFD